MLPFFLAVLSVSAATADLSFDSNDRLDSNFILFQDTEYCRNKIKSSWEEGNPHSDMRNLVPMTKEMQQGFVESDSNLADSKCLAICVDTGLPRDLITYPLPFYVYNEPSEGSKELNSWLHQCRSAEVGFVSYLPQEARLFWLNKNNERQQVGVLKPGEFHTVWQNSFLGHQFEIVDAKTNDLVLRHKVMHHAHIVVGHEHHELATNQSVQKNFNFDTVSQEVERAMSSEWAKSNHVTRTFTPLGFSKGRLPKDVWGSVSAYYYNNKNNVFAEEWTKGNKGYFVNWWEVTPYMVGIPWNLKRYWQTRLREMVSAWIGGAIPLENTDIYGIRRYEDGARLLTHVDREATHAVSLIVNVEQVAMREPWMVEIYDFAGRLHEVSMEPGDVVYYESAKCLHGRMKPLQGASYSNFFTHYRPVNDPQWSTRPNPEGTPEQVLSIDHCQKDEQGIYDCNGVKLPFLSPSNEVVNGPNDLFAYWKKVSPKFSPRVGAHTEF